MRIFNEIRLIFVSPTLSFSHSQSERFRRKFRSLQLQKKNNTHFVKKCEHGYELFQWLTCILNKTKKKENLAFVTPEINFCGL